MKMLQTFKYKGKEIYVDFERLHKVIYAFAIKNGRVDHADDMAQWAVMKTIERIKKGEAYAPYMNKPFYVYQNYFDQLEGCNHQKGAKYNFHKNLISYEEHVEGILVAEGFFEEVS